MTTNDELRQLRALASAATPGPWELDDEGSIRAHDPEDEERLTVLWHGEMEPGDARLTVAAVNALPRLLDELEAEQSKVAALRDVLDEAIVQAVNLGALVRTDPRIKGTPMALEVKLREARAALAVTSTTPGASLGAEE